MTVRMMMLDCTSANYFKNIRALLFTAQVQQSRHIDFIYVDEMKRKQAVRKNKGGKGRPNLPSWRSGVKPLIRV
jgi:hypothetical protein